MLKQGAHSAGDTLLTLGIALVIFGVIAVLAPLTSGVLFDILFGALLTGAGIVEFVDAFRSGSWERGARPSARERERASQIVDAVLDPEREH